MGSVPVKRHKRARPVGGPQTFRSPTAVAVWWVWLLFATANWIDLAVQGRDKESLVAAGILLLATGVAYVTAQRPRIIADDTGVTIRNPLRDHRVGWARVTKIDLADLLRVHCDPGQLEGLPPEGEDGKRARVISAWAVHYSRRRQFAAEAKVRRVAARESSGRSPLGLPSIGRGRSPAIGYGSTPASSAEADAEKIVRQLGEYATAAKAETVWAAGTVEIAGADQAETDETDETGMIETAEPGHVGSVPGQSQDARLTGWLEPLASTWSRTAIAALVIPILILLIVALV
ncbi:MAG: PH domain-containing protein [Streptosporangiaceae bacterium]